MRLSIAGLPPVASHLTCLLLGAALVNLRQPAAGGECRRPPRSLIMTPPAGAMPADHQRAPRIGARLDLLRVNAAGGCRLVRDALTVGVTKPIVGLVAPYGTADDLAAAVREVRTGSLRIAPNDVARPLCAAKPKVTYGVD